MSRRVAFALVAACYVFIVTIRISAPVELDNRDQAKQGLYILDVFEGTHFFLPTCRVDTPASKPPLYNWAAAAISLAYGKVTGITVALPSVLCGFGIVILTFLIAEMLFSTQTAFFSGLVLCLNYHFTTLSCVIRTDMMLAFFITLSLFFFLLAYRNPSRTTRYSLLMFTSFGLGTITKGPIGLAVPLLLILVFLIFKQDLKFLRSMRFGWGMLIFAAITLGWFIPALIEGGSEFFNLIIRQEMVERTIGIGRNGYKGIRPMYFLVPHFFGKFLPWSLFMPSALVYYWKSRRSEDNGQILFPAVWFSSVLIFFSLPAGKRYDYILPLYPAAAIIIGHFWYSVLSRASADGSRSQVRTLSLIYLIGYGLFAASLLLFLAVPTLAQGLANIFMIRPQEPFLLRQKIRESPLLLLSINLPLLVCAMGGIRSGLKKDLQTMFLSLIFVAGLSLPLYFHVVSDQATGMDGEQKKAFCARAIKKTGSAENLQFCYTQNNSIMFYMGKNVRRLSTDDALKFLKTSSDPYLLTTESIYKSLQRQTGFQLMVLEESEYLIRDKKRFVLVGKEKRDESTAEAAQEIVRSGSNLHS